MTHDGPAPPSLSPYLSSIGRPNGAESLDNLFIARGSLEQTIIEKRAVMLDQGVSLERADQLLQPMWMISDLEP